MPDNLTQLIDAVADRLADAAHVACMTGAGVSAESGVPTFRDADGLWEGHRPEDVATPEAFARDPNLVWRFYLARRRGLQKVEPNPAHHALAQMERCGAAFSLITQNVDGLHQRAGSSEVITLHGDIMIDRCSACEFEAPATTVTDRPPTCARCGEMTRPGVVWFGEVLPADQIERAAWAVNRADVMLVVGTSSLVYPAASFSMLAKQAGAAVFEINPNPTPLTQLADALLQGKAGEILPRILQAWQARRG